MVSKYKDGQSCKQHLPELALPKQAQVAGGSALKLQAAAIDGALELATNAAAAAEGR